MKLSPILFLFVAGTSAFGCKKDEPSRGHLTPTPSAVPAPSVVPTPSAMPAEVVGTSCPLQVVRLTFTGCNPRPSQDAHPECTHYELGPLNEHADHGCIPGLLRLAVSGYPGRLEVALVEAKPSAEGRVDLVVDSLLESTTEGGWAKGTRLGELVLSGTRVEALALSGALKPSAGPGRVSCPGAEGQASDCVLTKGAPP